MNDFVNEFVTFILQVIFWYFVFELVVKLLHSHLEEKLEIQNRVIKKLNSIVHQVKIEKENEVQYWYDVDTGDFIAQGQTLEEIQTHLRARFTEDIFVITDKFMAVGPDYKIVLTGIDNLPKIKL